MRRVWHESFAEPGSTAGQAAGQRRSLARALLLLAIGALCLAALVAIGILLFGRFGETEGEILLTVVAIAGYSLLGLAATTALGRAGLMRECRSGERAPKPTSLARELGPPAPPSCRNLRQLGELDACSRTTRSRACWHLDTGA